MLLNPYNQTRTSNALAVMHKVSMQNFLDFYILEKKRMKYNKTSKPLSGLRNTNSLNPRRKIKALWRHLCRPSLYSSLCCLSVLGASVTLFCLSFCFGEPRGPVWVQCSQLRAGINHVGNLSASSRGTIRDRGRGGCRTEVSSCLCS